MDNKESNKALWEILVPATANHGNGISIRYHQMWDDKVRAITGGLTIMPVAKGEWVHGEEDGVVFREPMIPVRLYTTHESMAAIAAMTMEHYDQIAVMYYLISTEVTILKRGKNGQNS